MIINCEITYKYAKVKYNTGQLFSYFLSDKSVKSIREVLVNVDKMKLVTAKN